MKRSDSGHKGIGSHHSAKMIKDEWLTPPWVLEALGPFDLDPCAPIERPWDIAKEHYTIEDNGLFLPWKGRVWCNPPYGQHTGHWLARCVKHNNAIALIYARTETKMFFKYVWSKCDGLLFIKDRLYFYHSNGERASGNSGGPSVLIAYGKNNLEALKGSGIKGALVENTLLITD